MKILPRLTRVQIKDCDLYGTIKAVLIEGDNIKYQVSYFNNGAFTEAWLMELDFVLVDKVKYKETIGFK